MFKSLLFLGALAPSMLSGNVPPRSLDSQPSLQVGDVYRFDIDVNLQNGLNTPTQTLLFNGSVKLLPSTFTYNVIGSNYYDLSLYFDGYDEPLIITYVEVLTGGSFEANEPFTLIYCEHSTGEYTYTFNCFSNDDFSISYSFDFEIINTNVVFDNSLLPYLTKVETPYTPPAKSNLYRLIYDFYYSLFNDDDLSAINTSTNLPFDSWLCHSLTIITLIGLVFILFLLLRWLFKVISGLILLKQ